MPLPLMSKSATLLCVFSAGFAAAHEHHDDKIPEGGAISPDSIVQDSAC